MLRLSFRLGNLNENTKKKTNVWNYDDKSHLRVLNYAISIGRVNFAHLLHISNIEQDPLYNLSIVFYNV